MFVDNYVMDPSLNRIDYQARATMCQIDAVLMNRAAMETSYFVELTEDNNL